MDDVEISGEEDDDGEEPSYQFVTLSLMILGL